MAGLASRAVAGGLSALLLLSAVGCRVYDIRRDQLDRVLAGERFVEATSGLDPQHRMITLREDEAITLRDAAGNEIKAAWPSQLKERDLRTTSYGQVSRFDQHRFGIAVGWVLGLGAVATAIALGVVLGTGGDSSEPQSK